MRSMTRYDTEYVINCLLDMHRESPVYCDVTPDVGYACDGFRNLIEHPSTISSHDEWGKGFMLGSVGSNWFSPDIMAFEMLLYVKPKYRGSSVGLRLLKDFEQKAKDRGAVEIRAGATLGINDAAAFRLYEHLGYERLGTGVRKRLQ